MRTVFITGASSGIGKETAKIFAKNNWNVVATMRTPGEEQELTKYQNVCLLPCDVTDVNSIQFAVSEAIRKFGQIDVLVNNAGYYTVGALEGATSEQINRQINTNLTGLIETTKEVLPHMRKKQSGVIINLSSIAGVVSIPLQTLYHATKFAIEGFTESLKYETELFGVRVKLIEPGVVNTNFSRRSMTVVDCGGVQVYQDYHEKVIPNLIERSQSGSEADVVAKTIYKAAIDGKRKLRYPTAKNKNMIRLYKLLPLSLYQCLMKSQLETKDKS